MKTDYPDQARKGGGTKPRPMPAMMKKPMPPKMKAKGKKK